MDRNDHEPDVICNTQDAYNINSKTKGRIRKQRACHSNQNNNISLHKSGSHCYPQQQQRHHHIGGHRCSSDGGSYKIRVASSQNDHDGVFFREGSSDHCQLQSVDADFSDTHSRTNKVTGVIRSHSFVDYKSRAIAPSRITNNVRNSSTRDYESCRMRGAGRMGQRYSPTHVSRSRSFELSSRNEVHVQSRREIDDEILKDIVRTLRSIGDDLDAKMKHYNQPLAQIVINALKVNAGHFLLMAIKQLDLVGVVIDSSLALFKSIRH